jgi:phage-related tail protein
MTATDQAAELALIARLIRRAGKAGPDPTQTRAVRALADLSNAATRLLDVQRELADSRDRVAVVAIPEGWGAAGALAKELGVTPQTISKWRRRGEKLAAVEAG